MTHKNLIRTLFLSLSAVSLVAITAAAHEGGRGFSYEGVLKHADKNGDGLLQVSELPPRMAQRFASADTNSDGVLSKDEFTAQQAKLRAEHLAKMDTDHDGKISDEERAAAHQAMLKERFTKMDKNGDGQIVPDEVGPQRWSHLASADTDKNGAVSLSEMEQARTAGGGHCH